MASIASLVPKLRPVLTGAALLAITVFALRDSQHCHDCGRPHVALASLEGSLHRAPQALDWSAPSVDPWDRPTYVPWLISPAPHPDARPWPQGMVIGMGEPLLEIDPGILQWEHSPLDGIVSALVAGLLALES